MRFLFIAPFVMLSCVSAAAAQPSAAATSSSDLRLVVVITRHGVRSPTDPTELTPYAAKPWPVWEVPPGNLTLHGATLMTMMGASYRAHYAAAGLLPSSGCPAADSVYVWADIDQRTKATATALLDGLAPNCGLASHDNGSAEDPLFDPLPQIAKADPATASASVLGSVGEDPQALLAANADSFARLDAILGCGAAACRRMSSVPIALESSRATGLAGLGGALDLAGTAVEDFILAYADGKPLSEVGWGAVDHATLLELTRLRSLRFTLTNEAPYISRARGSNLLAHTLATIDQAATGARDEKTRVPAAARFVAFVGHDSTLGALAGILRLHWLMPGYQLNDTPPGGALVFELHRSADGAGPFVRLFYAAQSLDQMRTLSKEPPQRVAVFVPGCPSFDCPVGTFDRIVNAAIDPAFVGPW